jgi:hypothetical protein
MLTRSSGLDTRHWWEELYVLGYTDYRDRFGGLHRTGYARLYSPALDDEARYEGGVTFNRRNNLVFVPQPGYNYDIEINEQGQPKKERAKASPVVRTPACPSQNTLVSSPV